MKQPSVYSREQIISAALELVRENGWKKVTTRAIAKKLGSSTMPIYSHVRSVEELENEIRLKARQLLKAYQRKKYSEHVLLNLAFGYIAFARDEKKLFRFLYLESPSQLDLENGAGMKESFLAEFGEDTEEGIALKELKISGQEAVIQYTWIFTHGLAMLVNAETIKTDSDQSIMQILMDAGEAFYTWGIQKEEGGNSDESIS